MAFRQFDDNEEFMYRRDEKRERSPVEHSDEIQDSYKPPPSVFIRAGSSYARSRSLDPSSLRSEQHLTENSQDVETRSKELIGIRLRHQHSMDLLDDTVTVSQSKARLENVEGPGLTFKKISERADDFVFRLKVWLLESELDHPRAVAIEAEDVSSTVLEDIMEIESSAHDLLSLCSTAVSSDLQDEEVESEQFLRPESPTFSYVGNVKLICCSSC
jgi:hypothetical protein